MVPIPALFFLDVPEAASPTSSDPAPGKIWAVSAHERNSKWSLAHFGKI